MTDRRFRMMGSAIIASGGAIGSDSSVGALIALVFCILFLMDWIPPLIKDYSKSSSEEENGPESAETESEAAAKEG